MVARFKADIEQLKDAVAVRLAGELDASTAVSADDVLQKAIDTSNGKALLIDCTDLHYISSAGLGVILSSLHACKHHQTKVIFCGLQPKIKNVFNILGLEKLIVSAENEADAMLLLRTDNYTTEQ